MITVTNLKIAFGERILFKDVNLKFLPGNCYGLIGANGSGKSTFLSVLSGELEQDQGEIIIPKGLRLAVLAQDHYLFNDYTALHTVIKGHSHLYDIMAKREELYSKSDMTEEEGLLAGELEGEFAELNGYEAESEAATLLAGLGIEESLHDRKMADIEDNLKVRILLAQAIFGNPDILLLDEPTNHLDLESVQWFEEFLYRFQNTVVVVSHDRHFLNKVCTHIADIDFNQIKTYVGNYAFWQQASQLASKQKRDQAKKAEARADELKAFIQRFASNAARSKQATSRKKELEKLALKDIPTSSRRFPYVSFKPNRDPGKIILEADSLKKSLDGELLFDNFSFTVNGGDKIAFVGPNNLAKTVFLEILTGNMAPDSGSYTWGTTITTSYFPKDNSSFFERDINMTDWLRQYSEEQDDAFVRGFLGRMLFSGDESLKSVSVLSGGEKVRCLLARMMLSGANVLLFDEPTAHLDLESITALNEGLINFTGVALFSAHDHEFISTIANRIVEFTPGGVIDKSTTFEEYLANDDIKALRDKLYGETHQRLTI